MAGAGNTIPSRLARFELQHSTAERVPFKLAAQPNERRVPAFYDLAYGLPVANANAVHGVRACRGCGVSHQAWRASGHVGQEEVRHLHVGDRVPGGAHAALVSAAHPPAPVSVQVSRNTAWQFGVLRNSQEHHGRIATPPPVDGLGGQIAVRQHPTVSHRRMEKSVRDAPHLGFGRPEVEEVVGAADIADSNRSDVAETHRAGIRGSGPVSLADVRGQEIRPKTAAPRLAPLVHRDQARFARRRGRLEMVEHGEAQLRRTPPESVRVEQPAVFREFRKQLRADGSDPDVVEVFDEVVEQGCGIGRVADGRRYDKRHASTRLQ